MSVRFTDRSEAGRQLAAHLRASYADRPDLLVLGLPRGGVPVAYEVAGALKAPLDLCLVRKLGVPGNEELAMGALAAGGVRALNPDVLRAFDLSESVLEAVVAREAAELTRRDRLYRDGHPQPTVQGKTVLVVDDGLATGATMRAAVAALRVQKPARIVVAVPVGSPDVCERLRREADEVVCLLEPTGLGAVGFWYDDFAQVSDDEVRKQLAVAWAREER